METTTNIKCINEIRNYIVENFLFGDGASLQNDSSFMESGILDSTGVLELVAYLESTFAIKVADREIVPENLDSVNRAAAFAVRKTSELEGEPSLLNPTLPENAEIPVLGDPQPTTDQISP